MMASAHHPMTLAGLLGDWVPAMPEAIATRVISDLSLHSATIAPGAAFVAVAGQRAHGIDHAEQAIARGACVILHDELLDPARRTQLSEQLPLIEVPQLRERLPQLAARFWPGLDQLDLVAVTGTNGKTSLAWLLAQALDGAMIGTLGIGRPGQHQANTHTTPDVLSVYRHLAALQQQGMQTVVLEASSHALDQNRLAGLRWRSVIFTHLGHDHLDYHGSVEAYAAAKQRLFTEFSSERQLINADDAFGQTLIADLKARGLSPVRYGLQADVDALATVSESTAAGLALTLRIGPHTLQVASQLLGHHNAYNLLIVATELVQRGYSAEAITQCLERLSAVPGRMQAMLDSAAPSALGPEQVIIDYAHDPEALHGALSACRALTQGQLWCVFGCGGDRDRSKRPRMGRVAESLADHVILTDDNPRHEDGLAIIREIQAGMHYPERARVQRDRAQAIALALHEAEAADVVLVAGKGHESEQIIGDQRLPFSDQQQVAHWLEAQPC